MMNSSLKALLDSNCEKWWLDSGSLLGLFRDGHFLEQDEDIDIGIILKNESITRFVEALINFGYRIVFFKLEKTIYKIKAIPTKESPQKLILDFQIYKKYKEKYICPQIVFKKNSSPFYKIKMSIIRAKKGSNSFAKKYFGFVFSRKKQSISFHLRTGKYYDLYMWKIDLHFIENDFAIIDGYNRFANTEDYLELRYGNWTVPIKEWNFTTDDKGISLVEPNELEDYEKLY